MYANAGSEVAAMRRPQKVVHILRAPLGGVMRHVGDLLTAQHDLGLEIGLITASNWGGDVGNRALQSLQMKCSLGIHRIPMDRLPSPRDLGAYRAIRQKCRAL